MALIEGTLPSGAFQLNRAGRVVAEGATGTRDFIRTEPCTPTTQFQAASISKLFVATATMLLTQRGALSIDDPVSKWWADAPEAWAGMRVRHLLEHTSGLPHWGGLGAYDPVKPPVKGEILDRARRVPLGSEPGQCWRYSGPGYLVAAAIVEAAGGCDYGTFITENVFRPLGMTSTTSGLSPSAVRAAVGIAGDRAVPAIPELTEIPGTGDLWTTTGDLLLYADAVSSGGVLAEESWELMGCPQAAVEDAPADPVTATAYGHGTYIGTVDGRPARFHHGDNPGYRSILVWLPQAGVTFAVLANDDSVSIEDVAVKLARSAR